MYCNIDDSRDDSCNGGDFVAVVDDDDDNSKHKQLYAPKIITI